MRIRVPKLVAVSVAAILASLLSLSHYGYNRLHHIVGVRMLISVDEPYWNSSVAASMSETYLQHFELVTKNGDTPGAFKVLERVRGRTLAWALEDKKAFPLAESGETATLEADVAGLQGRLMQTNSAVEREQLLDKLVEYR